MRVPDYGIVSWLHSSLRREQMASAPSGSVLHIQCFFLVQTLCGKLLNLLQLASCILLISYYCDGGSYPWSTITGIQLFSGRCQTQCSRRWLDLFGLRVALVSMTTALASTSKGKGSTQVPLSCGAVAMRQTIDVAMPRPLRSRAPQSLVDSNINPLWPTLNTKTHWSALSILCDIPCPYDGMLSTSYSNDLRMNPSCRSRWIKAKRSDLLS